MRQKITIKEIAELAGTSKTTVSFYLNGKTDKMSEDTKQRITKVIKEHNYRPSMAARLLNSKSTCLLGVIIGDITNTFANQIVKGIDDIAREKKYQLIVGNSNYIYENEEKYVDRMLAMGVDGFIVQPSSSFQGLIEKIKNEGKGLVFIDSQVSMENEKWVKTNNYEAVLEATDQLMKQGYENFIMLTADPSVLSTRLERTRGFLDALEIANKNCVTEIVENEVSANEIADRITKNLKLGSKTLIFVANCWLLPKVYVALKNYRNLMPDTIGLIGFDNLEWTNFSSPTVTSIVQPAYEEGVQSARILIDTIENIHEEAPNQILQCSVNYCESTNIKKI